ncbi:ATP-dependent DNA ligase [Agrococcus carbonis]|uniref:DNA ligase (ATP) n=1 Tax=Agrococcus carbonis TaxID=684552 RepID=A0A1H1NU05_9MICO|nr:ATP-dependent DNA ligase [Agrococcus carbonis]SDS02270.1 ATP-dependent DNA ligase LigD ligase module /ATP-dependent DNA ligase LigD phosphoesterase module /ATP-dependent DNA ligase LigD polymerase module [Agrococcus carbonis]
MADADRIAVGGRRLRFSNPDKVLYPATGTTKRDVLEYVLRASAPLMAHMAGRPVTRKRWPDGVGTEDAPGEVFFQKTLERGAPEWIQTIEQRHSTGPKHYPVVTEPAVLAWMAQMGALELHVPQWRVVDGERWNPDRLVLDLDPGEGATLDDCARVALWVRELLIDIGLDPVPLTSGSKGIHLYTRLDGTVTSEQASEVAHQLARSLEEMHPDLIVSDMKKAKRQGKVLIDWSQNSGSKTTVAPYSLRGRLRPTVAAPRTWDEIEAGGLTQLEYGEVLERLERDGDLIAALDPPPDRLAKYRGLRSASRTPEPIPEGPPVPGAGTGDSWVVHEHHARRLHYDLRLEQEGVLVSWAVPKGLPGAGDGNRLAVQTEDHPLEYGGFEGTIPKGEYGAGEIRIWDAGRVELEKFRDDEVIGTLHGRPDGGLGGEPYRFALIRTDAEQRHWLLHRMKEQDPARDARKKGYAPPVVGGSGAATEGETPAAGSAEGGSAKGGSAKGGSAKAGSAKAAAKPAGARAKAAPQTELRPMLATAADASDIDDEAEWSYELKWDGWRAIVQVSGDEVRLVSRGGKDYAGAFPELAAAVPGAVDAEEAVLDGEIVVLQRSGSSAGSASFAALQERGGLEGRQAARAAARTPATLMLFDVLEVEGRRLVDEPLEARQARLAELVREGPRVKLSKPLRGDLASILEATSERGLEGVMAKRRESRYRSGARSGDWLKLKHVLAREVVVIGWLEGKGSLAGTVGSLVLALPGEGGRMRYAGRVGTGFTDAQRDRLREQLRERKTVPAVDDLPSDVARTARWVRATVAEVEHTELTASGALRHPVWRGLRPDKSLADLNAR